MGVYKGEVPALVSYADCDESVALRDPNVLFDDRASGEFVGWKQNVSLLRGVVDGLKSGVVAGTHGFPRTSYLLFDSVRINDNSSSWGGAIVPNRPFDLGITRGRNRSRYSYPRLVLSPESLLSDFISPSHLVPNAVSYTGIPCDHREGGEIQKEHVRFPPLPPTFRCLGVFTLGWGWPAVRFSETDPSRRMIDGVVCTAIGATVTVSGIGGLVDWRAQF